MIFFCTCWGQNLCSSFSCSVFSSHRHTNPIRRESDAALNFTSLWPAVHQIRLFYLDSLSIVVVPLDSTFKSTSRESVSDLYLYRCASPSVSSTFHHDLSLVLQVPTSTGLLTLCWCFFTHFTQQPVWRPPLHWRTLTEGSSSSSDRLHSALGRYTDTERQL